VSFDQLNPNTTSFAVWLWQEAISTQIQMLLNLFVRINIWRSYPFLERRWRESRESAVREELKNTKPLTNVKFVMGIVLNLKHSRKSISIILWDYNMSVTQACIGFKIWDRNFLKNIKNFLSHPKEITTLGFLQCGLGYLSLSRAQELYLWGKSAIRLASQIASGLTGVLYVLDEPSIGLHQRDNDRCWQL